MSTNHNLFEEKGEPTEVESNRDSSAYQPDALPLGQTGSLVRGCSSSVLLYAHRDRTDYSGRGGDGDGDDDDVRPNVLGCRVDILGTNCKCGGRGRGRLYTYRYATL